jgi:hypothetical protein
MSEYYAKLAEMRHVDEYFESRLVLELDVKLRLGGRGPNMPFYSARRVVT